MKPKAFSGKMILKMISMLMMLRARLNDILCWGGGASASCHVTYFPKPVYLDKSQVERQNLEVLTCHCDNKQSNLHDSECPITTDFGHIYLLDL